MKTILVIPIILIITSCASSLKDREDNKETGFLSDYSRLENIEDNYMKYKSNELSNYTKFLIQPSDMVFSQEYLNKEDRDFTDEELEDLQEYLDEALLTSLKGKESLEIVNEPGYGVAIIRVAITDVKKTIGALNLTIYTKITGVGLGGVAIEGEVIDSLSGKQLGATIRWGSGSRIFRAGYTKTGDAKILLKKWSKDFAEKLSQND